MLWWQWIFMLGSILRTEGNVITCPRVYAVDGRIKIEPSEYCSIYSDTNVTYVGNAEIIPGFWYGLVNYKCNNCTGSIISKFQYIDCGVYCIRNDMNIKCRSFWFPTISGIILGLIMLAGSLRMKTLFLTKLITKLQSKLEIYKSNRKERKLAKFKSKWSDCNREGLYSVRIPIEDGTVPSAPGFGSENHQDLINDGGNVKEALAMLAEFEIKDAILTIQNYNKEMDVFNSNIMDKQGLKSTLEQDDKMVQKLRKIKREASVQDVALTTAIGTLLLLAGISEACMNTLYLTSSGEVCDSSVSKHISSYSFPMTLNDLICLRLGNGELLKIQFTKAIEGHEYYPIYETALFSLKTSHHWQCKRLFSQCWYNEKCQTGYQLDVFKPTGHIENYDCFVGTLGCDSYCAHQTSCTWIHWWLEQHERKYPVYKVARSYWEVWLTVSMMNITREIRFDANKIQNVVSSSDFYDIQELPMIINSYISDHWNMERFLIKVDGTYHQISASERNFPVVGQIGEYQIALNNESRTYSESAVKCSVISCNPVCQVPRMALARFLESKKSETRIETPIFEFSDKKVKLELYKRGSINLLLGNVDMVNLHIAPANCRLELVGKFGCEGCEDIPYIVLKSVNVLERGTMKFNSNCTFAEKLIGCTSEFQRLHLSARQEECYIHIPQTNQTLFFKMEYEFLGSLIRYNSEFSVQDSRFVDTAMGLISNSNFLDSIKRTLIAGTIVTIILSLISKVFRYCYVERRVMKGIEE